ncbi:MAG: acetate/propionate family kinase, partial [Lentisphaerae bacterium]
MTHEEILAKGIVERIGLEKPHFKYECVSDEHRSFEKDVNVVNHGDALQLVCDTLVSPEHGVLKKLDEVQAIGHRIVHGGEMFTESTLINDQVKEAIAACASLAPLHNPPNLGGVMACEKVFPGLPNVAVFDTAFHQTMPPSSYLYAIPYDLYEKEGIRKYGFHGTSHKFVAQATAQFLGKDPSQLKQITCHLGNGASIAAVDGMKVVDTTMGMTPLAGLVMGTRCGDIDPGVVLHLIKSGHSAEEVDKLLNKQSGLLAIAGIGSSDMRDICKAAEEGNERAKRALDMFVYRVVFYIGAYYTALDGADVVRYVERLGMLTREHHEFGDVLCHDPFNAVLMAWYRNNVVHTLALPSLIACLVRQRRRPLNRLALKTMVDTVFPYIAAELSIRDSSDAIDRWLTHMIDQSLLELHPAGGYLAPGVAHPGQARLRLLA